AKLFSGFIMTSTVEQWPAFEKVVAKYEELERQLADPAVIADRARFTQTAKEHGSLARMVKPYQEFQQVGRDLAQTQSLPADAGTDPARRQLAEEELAALQARHAALRSRLEDLLLVDPSEDFGSVIMEIRAGTGGDEAALFAGDLYGMYTHFARDQG